VLSPSVAEILIIGGASSVRISFGFTNPSLSCSCCPIIVRDELASDALRKLTLSHRSRDGGSSSRHSEAAPSPMSTNHEEEEEEELPMLQA
jgi:hypothetical protein